ncbi:thioredoxin [Verruconis gallopava]|uniref:Thioredoxin n=1 Tax=Verruconis gallopava TaxID=253628 RepID=A0A0D2A026_9PEZI|nr:thioredoxin [Verruconis gallopava]KIV99659.1 thioredoxin [Verruconis gallopava]
MWWYILAGVAVLVLSVLLQDRSPIPETSGHVHKIADPKELDTVLASNKSVVVDFYADWCPPCRAIAPVFSKLADENATKGKLAFAKVNVDHVKDVAGRYGITAMPTFVFFSYGKPEPVAVEGIKGSSSIVLSDDGRVDRVRGADAATLKKVVAALKSS